jgi:AAA domain
LNRENIQLIAFNDIKLSKCRRAYVKGIIPIGSIVVVWGPPKVGKSFWVFDLCMHVARGIDYRGRRVHQGTVVYCAFEGQGGFEARAEAYRRQHMHRGERGEHIPFYLQPHLLDLIKDSDALIAAIEPYGDPAIVVLDTLNRSLNGSESRDEDMSAYVRAADAIRERFNCAVIIVHHCGIVGTRPRGHTSLSGAADAQIAVMRDDNRNVVARIEFMKDGIGEGDVYVSSLIPVDLGADEDGDMMSSCVIVETTNTPRFVRSSRTSEAANVALRALRAAIAENDAPVSEAVWAEQAYALNISRSENPESMRAAFRRARRALIASNQVKQIGQTYDVTR